MSMIDPTKQEQQIRELSLCDGFRSDAGIVRSDEGPAFEDASIPIPGVGADDDLVNPRERAIERTPDDSVAPPPSGAVADDQATTT